jgi:putative hydrolase of the HAD superfamily
MKTKAILYDAGRTLLRPRMEAPDIWDFLGEQLGLQLPRERELPNVGHHFYSRMGKDGMGAYDTDENARSFWASYYIQAIREAGVDLPTEDLRQAADALYDWYQEPEQWEPYPETFEALERADALGLKQGIISDWSTDLVPILHAHEVTKHFDFVVASAAVRAAKPHPDIFRYALVRARLQPHEVLYVGDSYISDVLGARGVGIEAVLIDREGHAPEVDCKVVTSLLELFDLLK